METIFQVSLHHTRFLFWFAVTFDCRDEIARNTLGSQAGEMLLHELKPKHWFSAHLHCRFSATIRHSEHQITQFLALDKCLPRRKYLEVRFIDSLVYLRPKELLIY